MTYDGCEDHRHEFIVDLLLGHSVEVQAGLVGEEYSVLALDHRGSDAEEDDSDQRGEPAAIAATSRHYCFFSRFFSLLQSISYRIIYISKSS